MKINKTVLILGIISFILCAISSLCLCIIADLDKNTMKHTFDWFICLSFVFCVGGIVGVVGCFYE